MAITPLSTQPNSVTRPATFDTDSDTFHTELPVAITQINAALVTIDADATTATTQAGIATTKAGLTAADRVQTGLDAVATAADRVQTGLDRTAAAASAASAAAIAGAFVGTSTTSWTPAIGAKTFTTQTGEQYTPGATLTVVSAGTPSDWGAGQVATYSGTALAMNISVIGGSSGAHTDWNISLAGVQGPVGPAGAESLPSASAGGSADAITATFSPAITLANQQRCCVVLAYANATTTPTFAPNGLTAHTITKTGGSALAVGDLPGANAAALLIYNLANTRWELMNPAVAGILELLTPTNITPISAATGQGSTPTLTGTAFNSNYGATHANTQVQISTTSSFTSPLYSSGDQAASTSFTVPGATLTLSLVPYYWRIRYKNSRGNYSEWSNPTTFVTDGSLYITTPTPTPAFGAAFEGGFYSGLFWNELIQSSTSQNIATVSGNIAFTVSASAAYAYAGQVLEARSRANPANKIIGTVAGANLSTLILTVTSVEGSGTCTDWSIMSRYRNITAPKSTESSSLAYKNANTDAPAACQTLTEGLKATLAMIAAGDATVYPAAWYCHNLTTGGKNDWHLPARDVRELEWRNLKPTTDNNSTTGRPDSAINYTNLGSFDDTDTLHGHNLNSSPVGAAYSTTVPAQTSVSAFQTGNAEAFAYGSYHYWSASECSTTDAWNQYWGSGGPGSQVYSSKTTAYYVRAVRRSII